MTKNKHQYLPNLLSNLSSVLNTDIPLELIAVVLLSFFLSPFIPSDILVVVILYILLQSFINRYNLRIDNLDVEKNQQERKEIIKKITESVNNSDSGNISDVILLNLNQINEYYKINQNQAKNSFRLSSFLILTGFIAIMFAIFSPNFNDKITTDISLISGISGILAQFIGGANFIIYNKTITQLNIYYQQLIKAQDTMLAIELCNKVQEPEQKSKLIEKLIITLIDRNSIVGNSTFKKKSPPKIEKMQEDV
jgi:hypothetical protein